MSWLGMEYIHPHIYHEENYGLHHSWLYIMRAAAKIVFIGFGNVFFVAGLLLLFGSLIFDKQLALLSIFMLYVGILILYLQMYCRVLDAERSRESDDSQHCSAEMLPSHHVLKIDDPPQYETLSDLQPQLFKVTLPSYEDVCSYSDPSTNSSCVVPVHLPKPVKNEDLGRQRQSTD